MPRTVKPKYNRPISSKPSANDLTVSETCAIAGLLGLKLQNVRKCDKPLLDQAAAILTQTTDDAALSHLCRFARLLICHADGDAIADILGNTNLATGYPDLKPPVPSVEPYPVSWGQKDPLVTSRPSRCRSGASRPSKT
jgi:hypothetical protein